MIRTVENISVEYLIDIFVGMGHVRNQIKACCHGAKEAHHNTEYQAEVIAERFRLKRCHERLDFFLFSRNLNLTLLESFKSYELEQMFQTFLVLGALKFF